MGAIWFAPKSLVDHVSELIGYHAGLTFSIEEMCDLLSPAGWNDYIVKSENELMRVRYEDFEDIYFELLYQLGHTQENYANYGILNPILGYGLTACDTVMAVQNIFRQFWYTATSNTILLKTPDLSPFISQVKENCGDFGVEIALKLAQGLVDTSILLPMNSNNFDDWYETKDLETLFNKENDVPENGKFIDQRFINYLAKQPQNISGMHWRNFEKLTAEYFERHGFIVDLGPGRNDDGIDIRVWKQLDYDGKPPTAIIQCKRIKQKVNKVTVKGLYADIEYNSAKYGLIVTASEISIGAQKTIAARGYPIQTIEGKNLQEWLKKLHKPWSGIVRLNNRAGL